MKPDWSAAPEWASYAAQELSGNWLFHEFKPRFLEITGEWRSSGRWSVVPKVSVQAKDTLEQRPGERCKPRFDNPHGFYRGKVTCTEDGVTFGPLEFVENAQQE